jgi:hypothetical protein
MGHGIEDQFGGSTGNTWLTKQIPEATVTVAHALLSLGIIQKRQRLRH